MKLKFIFFLLFCFLKNLFCQSDFNKIKVLIAKNTNFIVKFYGSFEIYNFPTEKKIADIQNNYIKFSFYANKIKIDNYGIFPKNVFIKNLDNSIFEFENLKYKGDLYVVIESNKILLVNEIMIEEYLKGVLSNEISASWHKEAIKAQAVSARTFAYYFRLKNTNQFYHITKDTMSQVYTGITKENEVFNNCLEETKDEILVFDEKIIPAYFHSVCGGMTEDSKNVWGKQIPFLKSLPCNYCNFAPYYEWEYIFSDEQIINLFKKNGYKIEKIFSITPIKRSISGRWVEIKISGKPESYILTGNNFRLILGQDKIRSTRFRIFKEKNKWIFKGKGWGHGVGLCQWGAKKMAEKNYNYERILRYYFRGTYIKKFSPDYKPF